MNLQNTIVALIVLAALLYAGRRVWRKIKSFSAKQSSCGIDCGCGEKFSKK